MTGSRSGVSSAGSSRGVKPSGGLFERALQDSEGISPNFSPDHESGGDVFFSAEKLFVNARNGSLRAAIQALNHALNRKTRLESTPDSRRFGKSGVLHSGFASHERFSETFERLRSAVISSDSRFE